MTDQGEIPDLYNRQKAYSSILRVTNKKKTTKFSRKMSKGFEQTVHLGRKYIS